MLDYTGKVRGRYEEALRSLGGYLDQHQFTQIVLVETPEGFLVKGQIAERNQASGAMHPYPATYLFTNDDIDQVVEQAYRRRH
ncbi:MAG TPA: hypothetical protein VFI42_03345 [Thermomicrobiaceae bacterium]|nr:hypothetical protein [Thermomicrobiaceae bacterium]